MKKIIILLIIILSLCGCSNKIDKDNSVVDVELAETPSSFEELLEQSPVILEAKVLENPESFNYKDQTYYLSKIKVIDLLRDSDALINEKDEILLFQNDLGDIDPLVNKNENILCCLVKIEVPGYENVYRTVGLYKGKFKVENDKSSNSTSNVSKKYYNENFNKNEKLTIDSKDLKELIKTNKFKKEVNQKSKDEMEDLKEQELIKNMNKN